MVIQKLNKTIFEFVEIMSDLEIVMSIDYNIFFIIRKYFKSHDDWTDFIIFVN